MLLLPIAVLPFLKLCGLISDKLFCILFVMFLILVFSEVFLIDSFISFILILLYLVLVLFINRNQSKSLIIVLGFNDNSGVLIASDGYETKEFFCGFDMNYRSGDVLRIDAEFWKNI